MIEPYVYCQNICAPEHPQVGRGRNAWLTGTAAWTYVAATQWILGIRPTYEGPADRPRAAGGLARLHRAGARSVASLYEIEVTREGPGNAVSLDVDGKPVEGDVAPMAMGRVRVKATLR